jgi:membrane protease YdiL (CAAX protease family)
VAWAPKWPDQAWLWLLNNLLLVSLTEELLFRGYIQGGLQRLFRHEGLALLAAALLFGLAHLGAAGSGSTWRPWQGWVTAWRTAMAACLQRWPAMPASTWRTSRAELSDAGTWLSNRS